jgi:DNA-directed RNA polymerase subunit RPC12/RpoP
VNEPGPATGDDSVEGAKATASTLPCGKCGAELEFHTGMQRLRCGYCGHEQQIEVSADAAVIEYDLNDAFSRYLGQVATIATTGSREFRCQDCGADILVPAGEKTARCEYCGGRRLIEEQLPPEVIRPEGVLPFQFGPPEAAEKFRGWLAGAGFWGRLWVRLIRPRALQQRASVQDVHGVYVPFWTYDSHAHSQWTAQAGYTYYVTRTYRDSQGRSRARQERRVRWVWTSGARKDFFDDRLVCASRQYYGGELERLLKRIEPFPTGQLAPYDARFLAGFRAERYTVDLKAGWEIARRAMQQECIRRCSRDVPGDTQRMLQVRTSFFGQSFKLAVLPVFVMGYRYGERHFHVLINGYTGKVQGKAPLSGAKLALLIGAGVLLIAGLILLAILLSGP